MFLESRVSTSTSARMHQCPHHDHVNWQTAEPTFRELTHGVEDISPIFGTAGYQTRRKRSVYASAPLGEGSVVRV